MCDTSHRVTPSRVAVLGHVADVLHRPGEALEVDDGRRVADMLIVEGRTFHVLELARVRSSHNTDAALLGGRPRPNGLRRKIVAVPSHMLTRPRFSSFVTTQSAYFVLAARQ